MRVLLTGHHGYIGSIATRVLQEAGHDVVGLDTYFYEGCDLWQDDGGVETLRRDVRDVSPNDLRGFDAVVHLAALSNDPLGSLSPDLTYSINCDGSIELARAARAAGVERFVFASSCSMYGAADTDDGVDETAPLAPLTAYAESKVRAEAALSELADGSFSPVLMRNATAYGASPRLRLDVAVNNLTAWAYTTGTIRILSDGTPWRPLIHIEDISRATGAILAAPRELVHGEAFNIGTDSENYQVRDLAEIVSQATGCTVEYAGTGDPDARSYRVAFGRFAEAFPDFRFDWDVSRGVAQLLEAYERAGLTIDDFEGERFVRLRRITSLLERGALNEELRWVAPRPRTAA